MARLVVCALYDKKVEAFGRPMFVTHINSAVRSFTDEINNPDSELYKHNEDYDLFHLGEWDDSSAVFDVLVKPEFVVAGATVLKSE